MIALVRVALLAGAAFAPHVALELVDRRPLRPPDDIQCDSLVGLAAEALHLEVSVAGVERVAERRGRLGRPLEGEHAGVPRLAGQYVGIPSNIGSTLGQMPDHRPEPVLARLGPLPP